MTNEERQQAIEWLKRRPVVMAGAKRMYDLAVEALDAYVPDMNVGETEPSRESDTEITRCSDDTISRQAAINEITEYGDGRTLYMSVGDLKYRLEHLPSARPEIIRCRDCVYYDPPHVDDNGERREYKDMPNEAFDVLGTGLVSVEYGINVGGRCARDYNAMYSEDKRVFVGEDNYCGRAERRTDG